MPVPEEHILHLALASAAGALAGTWALARWLAARPGALRLVAVPRALPAPGASPAPALDRQPAPQPDRDVTAAAEPGCLERLAAIGRVAAGVAHEVNNPLTYVLGNLDAALERLQVTGADPELAQLLREARDGGERVRDIVRDLRAFARAPPDPTRSCDVAPALRAATAITRNELRHRARLSTSVASVPPVAMADGRLAQVLVNLLTNACQAIPEGRAAENEIRVSARADGGEVVLEVADSGRGMGPAVQARLFDPFFTTREPGDGMGLGLALSRAFVVEAGGSITVQSVPGRGSTFTLRLPAAALAVASPDCPVDAGDRAGAAPRLRVLVVDDEPLVARAIARVLSAHQVEVSTSAAAALSRLRSGDRYDAVVCDLLMPDVTGMDLHATLAAERPELVSRLIFLTGGAFTEQAREFVSQVGARVLEKPVDAAALRSAVAQTAAGSAAHPGARQATGGAASG